jgi:hypothetical protein
MHTLGLGVRCTERVFADRLPRDPTRRDESD